MGFFVELVDAVALVDLVLVSFCWVVDHTDLVMLVDEVAAKQIRGWEGEGKV